MKIQNPQLAVFYHAAFFGKRHNNILKASSACIKAISA